MEIVVPSDKFKAIRHNTGLASLSQLNGQGWLSDIDLQHRAATIITSSKSSNKSDINNNIKATLCSTSIMSRAKKYLALVITRCGDDR
jgi:hypothetical protein